MLRFAHPSRALLPLAALLTALLAAALLVPLVASALLVPLVASAQGNGDGDGQQRNEGIPAFPIVYERGTVTLDGEPVASGEIVVRVGDWERRARIPVVDGAFDCANDEGCLLVGPPSDYIDEPVTFHLNGDQQADLTYPFPLLGFPCFVDSVELRFGEGLEPRTEDHCPGVVRVSPEDLPTVPPTPTPTPTPAPTATPTPTPTPLPPTATPTPAPPEPTATPVEPTSDGGPGGSDTLIVVLVVLVGVVALLGVGAVALRRRRS